jgi:hypothetical protein
MDPGKLSPATHAVQVVLPATVVERDIALAQEASQTVHGVIGDIRAVGDDGTPGVEARGKR